MTEKVPSKRKKIAVYYFAGCTAALLIGVFYWLFFGRYWVYTDDAYVEGNQIIITPLVEGFITSIHSDDTFLAREGEPLVDLDRTDSLIFLEQSKERLAQTVREVCQSFHQVFAYAAEIKVKEAEYIKAIQDYEHRDHVIAAGGVSLEDYEHAVAALRASYFSLEWTQALYDKALALVQGTTIRNHPLVKAAADQLRDAWVQLYRTHIYSPVEGLVAQRKAQVGMWVKKGQPLMSVIPLNQIWVNANFKETQLKHMRIGQPVSITSDLYGREVVFHGKVVGLPGGAGNVFSLLPPQNLSGNWIKIVQRLPVRVALDPKEIKAHPLRLGLSMEATVDLHDQEGKRVPDSSAGSPLYETPIYAKEEIGDRDLIDSIIMENLDPALITYAESPFTPQEIPNE